MCVAEIYLFTASIYLCIYIKYMMNFFLCPGVVNTIFDYLQNIYRNLEFEYRAQRNIKAATSIIYIYIASFFVHQKCAGSRLGAIRHLTKRSIRTFVLWWLKGFLTNSLRRRKHFGWRNTQSNQIYFPANLDLLISCVNVFHKNKKTYLLYIALMFYCLLMWTYFVYVHLLYIFVCVIKSFRMCLFILKCVRALLC